MSDPAGPDLARGVAVIRAELATLPASPGVYRMLDGAGEVLYVGKARNLARRVASYTRIEQLPARIQRMVALTRSLEVVTTHKEAEALLLEANLIKRLRPRYNVLLRDDKSFPYILIPSDHPFPALIKHRGARRREGHYYGPFPSAGAVNRTLGILQRAFMLRNCTDAVFAQRSRPCLQYQIKRCTAPCVGYVDEAEYGEQIGMARDFLEGRSQEIQADLARRMQAASEDLDFETAARYRDRIRALAEIQSRQTVTVPGLEAADIFALAVQGGQAAVQVFFYRGGHNYGNRTYFPRHPPQTEPEDILAAFIAQFYANKPPPALILTSHGLPEAGLIAEALTMKAESRVRLHAPRRGDKARIVAQARRNAAEALARRLAETAGQARQMDLLAERLGLEGGLERIEIYDNSHIQGADPVGAMVVAGREGFDKSGYRKFNIADPGAAADDIAMMREIVRRRFQRAVKADPDRTCGTWPDLILLDGGKAQLSAAREVMADLGVSDIPAAAAAKGPARHGGPVTLHRADGPPVALDARDELLPFIQRLSEEAHRFAIGAHRTRRAKSRSGSPLDDVPGIGPKRKKALLHHFGSARAVARAGEEDLARVEGISRAMARTIHAHLQGQ